MKDTVQFYDRTTLAQIDWPDTEDGRYARAYLEPLMRDGTEPYIRNAKTTVLIARIENGLLPLTVNDREYSNSYVCAPYTHYIRYAKQELALLRRPLLERGLSFVLNILGVLMQKSQINRVVHINNWLLSTNLFPEIRGEQLVAVMRAVRERFPEHAVIVRSLCASLQPELIATLQAEGCKLVPSRQVYLYGHGEAPGGHEAKTPDEKDGNQPVAIRDGANDETVGVKGEASGAKGEAGGARGEAGGVKGEVSGVKGEADGARGASDVQGKPSFGNAKSRWLLKRDYALLAKNGYTFVPATEMTEADIPRIVELYKMLYLDKYSEDNPQFTERYISLAMRAGILSVYGLRKDGRLDAVMGYYCRNGMMTTPLFGYDTSLPQSLGLYRMLSACLLRQSADNGHLLHESAGAAEFKRNRGAAADMEYSAVYDRHLPFSRRWCWSFLDVVLNRFGVPLMRKHKL